jgi:purine catabolism regulator
LEDPESVLSLYVALLVQDVGERDPQLPRPPTSTA